MLTNNDIKSKIDNLWERLWSGGLSNPLDSIEQLSFLLFMKRLDEEENRREQQAKRRGIIAPKIGYVKGTFWVAYSMNGHGCGLLKSQTGKAEGPYEDLGPITPEERKAIMNNSPVKGKYDTTIDSESAYEMLQKRVAGTAASADGSTGDGSILGKIGAIVGTIFGTNVSRGRMSTGQIIARSVTRSVTNKVVGGVVADLGKSVGGSMGGSVGRALVRGALGGLLRR